MWEESAVDGLDLSLGSQPGTSRSEIWSQPDLSSNPSSPLFHPGDLRLVIQPLPFRPSGWNRGLPLRRRGGQGPHLAKRWEPRGFFRVAAGFSSYDGDLSLPLGLALGSPIFPSGCEGKLGVALESLQGRRDLT